MSDSDQSRLVTVGEAARALGKTPDAVRALVRRGTLEARPGNDGRPRVVLPPGRETVETVEQPLGDQARPSRPVAAPDRTELLATLRELLADPLAAELRAERDAARAEAAELRDRTTRAEVEAAHLKGELETKDALVVELRARAERAEADLAEARKPALLRLLEALRRRQ